MKEIVRRYLSQYPLDVVAQVELLLEKGALKDYIHNRYPIKNNVVNDAELRQYAMDLKNSYLKKSSPLSKVVFDNKIHVLKNALGTHTYVRRIQGSKVKSKNEIRVSTLFKKAPGDFLSMIVVHELAHIREKEHNKSFYKLCVHMLPEYNQIEFDCRLYLIGLEVGVDF